MTTFKGVMRGGVWRALIGIDRKMKGLTGNFRGILFACGFLRGKCYEFFSLFCQAPCR